MKEIIPSYIYINIPFFILLIIGLITGFISYFYYKRTIPPVSAGFRIFLGINRGIAIFFILLLLFAPELSLMWQQTLKPKILIAVDRSASMTLQDQGKERFKTAIAIAKDINEELATNFEVKAYLFDIDTISMDDDSLHADKLGTNIETSLTKMLRGNNQSDALVMISDGVITEGGNPLFSRQVKKTKILTIGIGDTSDVPDVLVKHIRANKIVYKNNPTTIVAEISIHGLDDLSTTIQLKQEGKLISAKNITLDKNDVIQPVEFELIPQDLGTVKYTVEVSGFESEEIKQNNKADIHLEVLKSKLHIGIFVAQPNYDIKFIKQILAESPDFIPHLLIRQRNNQYDRKQFQNVLDSADIFILNDFPEKNFSDATFNSLKSTIEKRNIPVLFIISGRSNSVSDQILKTKFPAISWRTQLQLKNIFAVPTISGKLNPILNIFDSEELNNAFWQNCSPIEYPFSKVDFGATDKIILTSKNKKSNLPVLIFNNKGANNAIFFGAGFWRWKFLFAEDRQFHTAWSTLVHNLMRWLSRRPGSQNINITVDNKVISLGEQLNLEAQIYDAGFNPVLDSQVQLKVSSPHGEFETEARNSGNGLYFWQYTPFVEGKYVIKATAFKNDVALGESEIEINVVPVNKEFIYTKQDKDFLQKLAQSTGGQYFGIHNYKQIKNVLPQTDKTQNRTKNYELWNKLPMLLLIILLLSIEWFIRKRKGLA